MSQLAASGGQPQKQPNPYYTYRYTRTSAVEARFNELFGAYISNAKKRGLEFHLDKDIARVLFQSNCHYCGGIPAKVMKRKSNKKHPDGVFVYNGIDRLDNTLGYVQGNCVACCSLCNHMKCDLPVGDFLGHIHKIAGR